MTITVAYRRRGSFLWSHIFHVGTRPAEWRSFYRHARLYRRTMEYAVCRRGEMVAVL